jgi:hypothetical protein
VRGSV